MVRKEYKQRLEDTGRNDICPCGSGKKYKKCHLQADEKIHSEALAEAGEEAAAKVTEGEEPEEMKEGPVHPPEFKEHKYAPKIPRTKTTAGARQVSIPRKTGTS